ncbi:hypothetical protein [Streptomyces sp. NRRL F-4474]|uniref:hypothetical protein n=1 Tax=Streptomyces sp. NRRL F-4474 TaxID=1463851 RepID=UPI0018FE9210|nr:hypothetical protein [Streptomyces sp. NRRL F-4474]
MEAIRTLRVARSSAVKARTRTSNQIRTLIVTGPADLRENLRSLTAGELIDTLARPGSQAISPTPTTQPESHCVDSPAATSASPRKSPKPTPTSAPSPPAPCGVGLCGRGGRPRRW